MKIYIAIRYEYGNEGSEVIGCFKSMEKAKNSIKESLELVDKYSTNSSGDYIEYRDEDDYLIAELVPEEVWD